MILPIYAYGQPVLKQQGQDIQREYPDLGVLIENMWETMYDAHGVGLAAPQIGRAIRLFVVDTIQIMDDDKKTSPQHEIVQPREQSSSLAIADSAAITELVRLYEETRSIIARKDETIQDLSYKLGRVETELKNTIPLLDYNKATFLLESAKTKGADEAVAFHQKIESLEKEVSKRNGAILSLALLFVLVLAFSVVFFFFSPQF